MSKTHGFRCPRCGGETGVNRTIGDSRGRLTRRRTCKADGCGHQFTTREVLTDEPIGTERRIGAHTASILLSELAERFGCGDIFRPRSEVAGDNPAQEKRENDHAAPSASH